MSAVFFRSIDKIGPIRATVLDHLLGRVSFGDAVRKVEAVFENSITTSVTGRFSKLVKPGERLFSLGHDPGPAYSFPGTGIVSEPSYTLGPHAEEIMFGPPQEAKKWLKERNLNYFMLGFEEPFLVGLPFSRLFNSENIALYFRVVAKEGDVYLLGWREENRKGEEVPTLLIQMNELRRTAASSYAFSEQWGRDLGPAVRPFIREGRLFLTDETGNALDDKIIQVLSNKMIGPVQLTENKALLGEAVLSVAANLRSNRRQLADAVNQRMRQGPPAGQEISALEGISWYVRSTLRDVYFKRYGPSLAKLLIGMNSPTKDIYESREVFRERLNLRR